MIRPLAVARILTRPPPDTPSTSTLSRSSCASISLAWASWAIFMMSFEIGQVMRSVVRRSCSPQARLRERPRTPPGRSARRAPPGAAARLRPFPARARIGWAALVGRATCQLVPVDVLQRRGDELAREIARQRLQTACSVELRRGVADQPGNRGAAARDAPFWLPSSSTSSAEAGRAPAAASPWLLGRRRLAGRAAGDRLAARQPLEHRARIGQLGGVDHAQQRHLGGLERHRRAVDLVEALEQQLPEPVDRGVAEPARPVGIGLALLGRLGRIAGRRRPWRG